MKKSIKIGLIVFFNVFLASSSVFAQDCVNGLDPSCDAAVYCPCPIDDGVLFLVAFALLIAAKKAYDYKKQIAF